MVLRVSCTLSIAYHTNFIGALVWLISQQKINVIYSLIGCLICVLLGSLVSLATGGVSQAADVPQPLLSPMLREHFGRAVPPGYFDVPQRPTIEEMQMLNNNNGTSDDINKC